MRVMAKPPEALGYVDQFPRVRQQVLRGRSLVESGTEAIKDLAHRIAKGEATQGDPITDFAVMRFGADASPGLISFFRGIQDDVASHVGELCALVTEIPSKLPHRERYDIGLLTDPSLIVRSLAYPGGGATAVLSLPVGAWIKAGSDSTWSRDMNFTSQKKVFDYDPIMRIDSGGKIIHKESSLEVKDEYPVFSPRPPVVRRIIIGDELAGAWYDERVQRASSGALKEGLVSAVQRHIEHARLR